MICKTCGNEVNINDKYCGVCGTAVEPAAVLVDDVVQPAAQDPYAQPQDGQPVQPIDVVQPQNVQSLFGQPQHGQPQYAQPQNQTGAAPIVDQTTVGFAGKALGFGIAALVCSCSFYFSFLGIIFGAIAKNNANHYAALYPLTGIAKTGRTLGKVGFILGIVFTSFIVLMLVLAAIDN